mgnify:CR=1 FL=1
MEIQPKVPNWKIGKKDKEYLFSLFFSSRKRPDFLNETLRRIYTKAENPSNIQTVIRLDLDDPELSENLKIIQKWNAYGVVGPRLDGYESLHIYYEECARVSSGRYLWQLNDDGWIETEKWDAVLQRELSVFSKDIFICCFDCLGIDGKGKSYDWAFPIMSRRMMNLLGGFCYGGVKYIDTILYEAGKVMNNIHSIPIQVIHQHIWDIQPDETSRDGCLAAYKWMTSPDGRDLYPFMARLGCQAAQILMPFWREQNK